MIIFGAHKFTLIFYFFLSEALGFIYMHSPFLFPQFLFTHLSLISYNIPLSVLRHFVHKYLMSVLQIRQYRRLEDGSINVVTRGQQRFRLRRRWIDADRVVRSLNVFSFSYLRSYINNLVIILRMFILQPCAEVQIVQEDMPLRTPRDVVGRLEPLSNLQGPSRLSLQCDVKRPRFGDDDSNSEGSFESELSQKERRLHQSAISSFTRGEVTDESTSSDEENFVCDSHLYSKRCPEDDFQSATSVDTDNERKLANVNPKNESHKQRGSERYRMVQELGRFRKVSRAFWPYWAYSMYDSYHLAQRAAGILFLLPFIHQLLLLHSILMCRFSQNGSREPVLLNQTFCFLGVWKLLNPTYLH